MYYIDLELPSGNLWASEDYEFGKLFPFKEARDFTHDEYDIPSYDDWIELLNCKYYYYENEGYRIYGKNKKSIFIPAKSFDKIYWSSTLSKRKDSAKNIGFSSGHDCIFMTTNTRKHSLRLIKKK